MSIFDLFSEAVDEIVYDVNKGGSDKIGSSTKMDEVIDMLDDLQNVDSSSW